MVLLVQYFALFQLYLWGIVSYNVFYKNNENKQAWFPFLELELNKQRKSVL